MAGFHNEKHRASYILDKKRLSNTNGKLDWLVQPHSPLYVVHNARARGFTVTAYAIYKMEPQFKDGYAERAATDSLSLLRRDKSLSSVALNFLNLNLSLAMSRLLTFLPLSQA